MGPSGKRTAVLLGLVTMAGLLTVPASGTGQSTGVHGWGGTWGASMMPAGEAFEEPNWSLDGFDDQTVRQVVRVGVGGAAARVRLSNVFGTTPLRVAGATVARQARGASVRPGSLRHVTFGGSRSVEVPPGGEVAGDPAWLRVAPLDSLTVTLYLARPTGPATFHLGATATSYRAPGDHRGDAGAGAFTGTAHSWYYLAGVDVTGSPAARDAVVAFGDSITDGGGGVDDNDRYPDELAEALAAGGRPRGVLNAGIGGNRVLTDSPCSGEKALSRFRRDALDQPGVGTVLVLEGVNDIGMSEFDHPCFPPARVGAAELIAGHRELIRQAHARGVRAIGTTLLPFKGSGYHTERGEVVRDELNHWIRTSDEYDAVADLGRSMAAPGDPDLLNPVYDSGDRLHPNAAGTRAMAEAVAPLLR